MKKIIYGLLLCLMLSGCVFDQGPDFSKPAKVISKIVYLDNSARYELDYHNHGVNGEGWGAVFFKAPDDFANVGDNLVIKDHTLIVVPKNKKGENNE